MLDCLEVAKYFIIKAYQDGEVATMTNMKVQKLLYYSQSLHLALFGEPLFDEEIQAWRYGPVCPPAYRFFSVFEGDQLPIPSLENLENIPKSVNDLLEEVWLYFGRYHPYYLSDMTHLEFPWKKARKGLPPYASSNEKILQEDMKLLGKEKLDEIEKSHPHYSKIISHILDDAFPGEIEPKYIKREEVNGWLQSLLT